MEPNARALLSLEGLSVGDAFGERFFLPDEALGSALLERREPTEERWRWTDDTEMALSVVDELVEHGGVEPARLAARFARRFDLTRGYGRATVRLLCAVRGGDDWEPLSRGAFDGRGSYGNGAAMRIAPLGGYFAHDVERAAHEAEKSAVITHAHEEGIAGAVAVAVAAAFAWATREADFDPAALLDAVLAHVRGTALCERVAELRGWLGERDVARVAAAVGNGAEVAARDTVPLCLWAVARHPDDYREALWTTVSALGDRDTTCAIVGGIVALRVGLEGVPPAWRSRREPLGRP